MGGKIIIAIGRQFGSGGREIGRKLAEALEIPFYDKELLTITAEQSGFCKETLEEYDEKTENNFLYSFIMGAYSANYLPIKHKLFLAQFDAIRSIADKGSCVIIGRCADYVLEGYEDCVRVFIHGDLRNRMLRATQKYGMDSEEVEDMVLKIDKERADYYYFYSGKEWGNVNHYDITIDSSILGVDDVVDLLLFYVKTQKSKI